MQTMGQDKGDTWVWSLSTLVTELDSFLTNASIATSFGRSGLYGRPTTRHTMNLEQSGLKYGRSGGLIKDNCQCAAIINGK
jgi:hypothetical protein